MLTPPDATLPQQAGETAPPAPSANGDGIPARAWLGYVRHLPDRCLHPLRRRVARARIVSGARPATVLFVCWGNIYRSPFASALFSAALPPGLRERVRTTSAGFLEPGRPSPQAAVEVAGRWGVDLGAHRSILLTPDRVRRADLIVVMEPFQQRAVRERFRLGKAGLLVLGDLDPEPARTRAIEDPWGKREEALEESYARIVRCVRELVITSVEAGGAG